jgi:hypothetical protein
MEPLDCAVHNAITRVFHEQARKHGGPALAGPSLQKALVKELLSVLKQRERLEKELAQPEQEAAGRSCPKREPVICLLCWRELRGRCLWRTESSSAWVTSRHRCLNDELKSSPARLKS